MIVQCRVQATHQLRSSSQTCQTGSDLDSTHQPDETAQHEGEYITDLDAQLAGGGHDDGVSALSPAQVGLLRLQVVDDGS